MPKRTEEFVFKITEKPVDTVYDIVFGNEFDVNWHDPTNQIITPTKIGWVGTESMNAMIQGMMHDVDEESWQVERHTWVEAQDFRLYKGDKVINTLNNYDLCLFNGESGVVVDIDSAGQLVIDFGDKVVYIPTMMERQGKYGSFWYNPQMDIDLGYAITTHKAQGSEYDNVMYVMNKSRPGLLNRRNFYTGMSRAKKRAILVADQKALMLSLYRKEEVIR